MAMSKDRVVFRLNHGYFTRTAWDRANRVCRANRVSGYDVSMFDVLHKAFGIKEEAYEMFRRHNYVKIRCRPSQFARFLIYRNQCGFKNGFMDLGAKLVEDAGPLNAFHTLIEQTGLNSKQVRLVLNAIDMDNDELSDRMRLLENEVVIDVSENPRNSP